MNTRGLAWQLPAALLLTAPLWHGAMASFLTLEQGPAKAMVHQDSSFLLEEVLFTQVSRDGDDLTLRAKRLHGTESGQGFSLEEADAKRPGPDPLHMSSGSAYYDPDQQILTALNHVVVETADLMVRTEALRYLVKYETLKSAAEVEIEGQGMVLTGTSFMYNLKSGALRVGQRVRFRYAPPASSSTPKDESAP